MVAVAISTARGRRTAIARNCGRYRTLAASSRHHDHRIIITILVVDVAFTADDQRLRPVGIAIPVATAASTAPCTATIFAFRFVAPSVRTLPSVAAARGYCRFCCSGHSRRC